MAETREKERENVCQWTLPVARLLCRTTLGTRTIYIMLQLIGCILVVQHVACLPILSFLLFLLIFI